MEKFGRVGQCTDDNIILSVRIARWITIATDTHSEYSDTSANEDNSFRNHIR